MEVSGRHHTATTLPMGKEPPLPTEQEAEWAPEPDRTFLENVQLHVATIGNAGKRRN